MAGPSGGCWARTGARGAAGGESEAIRYLSLCSLFAAPTGVLGPRFRGINAARTLRKAKAASAVSTGRRVRAVRVVLS